MMNQKRLARTVVVIATVALVPVLAGTMCGTNNGGMTPQPSTLLSEQAQSQAGIFVSATKCATPAGGDHGFVRSFNAVANKLVTVQVTGPASSSRPQIQVVDIVGNQVANTGATPTTQSNTTTFTPSASNLFVLRVNECAGGLAIGSVYTVLITQAP